MHYIFNKYYIIKFLFLNKIEIKKKKKKNKKKKKKEKKKNRLLFKILLFNHLIKIYYG